MLNDVETAKEVLLSLMQSYSERKYSSRWISGLEKTFWSLIRQPGDELSLREIVDANFYAGLCQGWWVLRDGQPTFISLNEWEEIIKNDFVTRSR